MHCLTRFDDQPEQRLSPHRTGTHEYETRNGLALQSLVPYTGHEHTAHGDAGAGMDVVYHLQHVVGSVVAFGISAIAHAVIAGIFITAGVFEKPSVGRSISVA